MKIKFFLFISLFFFSIIAENLSQEKSIHQKSSQRARIHIKDEIISQKTCKCIQYFYPLLDECMAELENHEYIENFSSLKEKQRKSFLGRTLNSIKDYKEFIDRFPETIWLQIWETLTPEEQTFFPRTKQEQREKIKRLEKEYQQEVQKIDSDDTYKRVGSAMACSLLIDAVTGGASLAVKAAGAFLFNEAIFEDPKKEKNVVFKKIQKKSNAFILEEK